MIFRKSPPTSMHRRLQPEGVRGDVDFVQAFLQGHEVGSDFCDLDVSVNWGFVFGWEHVCEVGFGACI